MTNILCVSHEWNLGFDELREMSNAGYRVIPVPNGYEAVRQFAEREIAAIVVNRRLPDIEIADLISYFRHNKEEIPIVMLSAVMPLASVPSAVDAVIHKSSAAGLLVPTLQVLLAGRKPEPIAESDGLPQAA